MDSKYYSNRPDLISSVNGNKVTNSFYDMTVSDDTSKKQVLGNIETVTQTVKNEGVSDLYVQTGDAYLGKISEMDTVTFGNAYDRMEKVLLAAKSIHDEVLQRIDGKFTKGIDNSLKSLNKVNGSDSPYETTHLTYETSKTSGEGNNIRTTTETHHYTLDELLGKNSPIVAAQTVYNNYLTQTRAVIESQVCTNMTDEEIMAQYYPTNIPSYEGLKRSQTQEDHKVGLSYLETGVAIALVVAIGAASFGIGTVGLGAVVATYGVAETVSAATSGTRLITGTEMSNTEKVITIASGITGVLLMPGVNIGRLLMAGGASARTVTAVTRGVGAVDDTLAVADIAQGTMDGDNKSLDLGLLILSKGKGSGPRPHTHSSKSTNLPNGADAVGKTNSFDDLPILKAPSDAGASAVPDVQAVKPETVPNLKNPNIPKAESNLSTPHIPQSEVDLTTPHIPQSEVDLTTPHIPRSEIDLTPPDISGKSTAVTSMVGGAAVTSARPDAVDIPKVTPTLSGKQTGAGTATASTRAHLPESGTRSPEWLATKRNFPNPGLTDSQSSAITGIAKGNRPDPSTYLSSDYISQHRAQFDNGAVAFARDTSNVERFGQFGRDDGAFVLPRDVAEAMIKEANGDPRTLETLLGLENGSLGDHPVLLEFDHVNNLRLPDGNEAGSNDFWRPGGLTYPGGVPEAIIDPVPADEVRAVKIW